MKKHIMKIRKVSTYSYALTLPKEVVKQFKWKERQKLVVLVDEKKKEFKIRDWKPQRKK